MQAHAVSTAVLERLARPRELRARGAGRGALHLDLDGFVVTLSAPGVPLMANAIAVSALPQAPVVAWDPAAPPAWDPVPPVPAGGRPAVAALAAWLAARMAVPEEDDLAGAPARLLGRGPGLTPEGDDVLCGMAAGLRALGPAAGMAPGRAAGLAAALCPADARRRTGALSATLLELAAAGAAPEPAHRLIAGGPGREAALADLRRLGASTGGAVAAGIAWAAEYVVSATAPG